MSARDHDLLVIGAGATGLAAARTARAAGRSVALVEAARPGGDCTHVGCVPSKTLLDVSHRVSAAREGRRFGVRELGPVDFAAVVRHVQDVIADIELDESPDLLRREGIDLLIGWARFVDTSEDGCTVDVDGTPVRAPRVVIASGAHAAVPPVDGLAEVPYLTNATVFELTERPAHLLVMGGGAIGVELAQAFAGLDTRVTVVEGAQRILGKEEPGVSDVMTRVLGDQGVDVRTGAQVTSARAGSDGRVELTLDDGTSVSGSHLLVAVGRRPATDGMDLERVGIETGRAGSIVTDEQLRTTATGVWAAGDCTTPLQFTHVGDAQGRRRAGPHGRAGDAHPHAGRATGADRRALPDVLPRAAHRRGAVVRHLRRTDVAPSPVRRRRPPDAASGRDTTRAPSAWSRRRTVAGVTREPGAARRPVFCLDEVEILQDLDQQEMASIAARAPMRALQRGSLVWSPADGREVLYIVKSGRVRLVRSAADGRTMTLAVLGPGALFGQMRLLGQDMRSSSAEAFEDVVLCHMSESDVRSLLLSDARVAARITEGLGRRLAEVEQRLADALLKTAPQRVAATLATLAGAAPAPVRLTGPRGREVRLTHAQLADLVGTTRETTTKVLGDLQARGVVALRRGAVVVVDLEGLVRLSDELV